MDFIVIYSNYSNACRELFADYPNLESTAVCADSPEMRNLLINNLHIVSVPTLLVVNSTDILQRVIGLENIKNWLWLTFNQADLLRAQESSNSAQTQPQMSQEAYGGVEQDTGVQVTSLDGMETMNLTELPQEDDLLPTHDVSHMLKSSISMKSRAEEMQREREIYFESLKKN